MMSGLQDAIVGICRFSFLGKCDWVGTRARGGGAPEVMRERVAMLYAEDRMQRRFQAFETLCLPSIRAQTDPDFSLWLLTSPELPAHWLDRLRHLVKDVPQIEILMSERRNSVQALKAPLRAAAISAGRPVIQFRIDDDDAISRHHIARLRREARRFSDLPAFGISYPKGLVYGSYSGRPIRYWRAHQSFVGIGAALRMPEAENCIYELLNPRIPRYFPVFTDICGFGYVQTRWDEGDSAELKRNAKVEHWFDEIDADQFRADLAEDFSFLLDTDIGFVRTPVATRDR